MFFRHRGHTRKWIINEDGERRLVCSCGKTLRYRPGDNAQSPYKGF